MAITQKTVDKLYKEQRGCCAFCHRPFTGNNPQQVHHAIYGREKQFSRWLDKPENLILLCQKCHEQHGDMSNWSMRRLWWNYKIELGYNMREWHTEIPMKVKDRFEDKYADKCYTKKQRRKNANLEKITYTDFR
jgi:hypothetical protein